MYWSPITVLLGIFVVGLVLYGIQQLWRLIMKKPSKSDFEEEVYEFQSNLNYSKYKKDNPEYDKYKGDLR